VTDVTGLRLNVTNVRANDQNTFTDNPEGYFEYIGENPDLGSLWSDNSDGTGARFRMTLFGQNVTGTGVIGDFEIPALATVTAARLHFRARCIDGDDRPAVTEQSVYVYYGSNLYGMEPEQEYWNMAGFAGLGGVGVTADVDIDLFSADNFYQSINNGNGGPFSPEAVAAFFTGAPARAGQPTINFVTGGYGNIVTEIYECYFELDGTLAEPEEIPVPTVTGLAGPTRTRFYPAT
jgi:hypothetical protein